MFELSSIRIVWVCIFLLMSGSVSWAPNTDLVEPKFSTVASKPEEIPPIRHDVTSLRKPRVRAQATLVYKPSTHEIIWESNGHKTWPIASITKVMTSLVFLEQGVDLTSDVVISRHDIRRASTTYLRRGERVTLEALLNLALVASDNAAARALARVSLWGTLGFVEQMNRKALELGLSDTTFTDPSGLNRNNVSTAYDLSRLISHATKYSEITSIMKQPIYRLRTSRRRITVRNTNKLLNGKFVIQAGKTGYIDASGYCLVVMVEVPESEPLAVVVLGARSNSGRFTEVRRLVNWVSTHGRSLIIPGTT